jgi:CBS domain containing-hemolysin-like protein
MPPDPDLIDGLTPISDVEDERGLDFGDEDTLDVDTVGGYVFHRLGRVAEVGDEVTLPRGERLRVEELDGLRIARVKLLAPLEPDDLPDDEGQDPREASVSGITITNDAA